MKRDCSLWQMGGFSFTALGGTLLHYLYDWTDRSVFIAPFSGVNESTFEHMKLLFWPMFLFALVERRFFSGDESFWCVKLVGAFTGLTAIPVLFYTYNGAIGKSPDWLNISFFFIAAAVAFIVETRLLKKYRPPCVNSRFCFWVLCAMGFLFAVLTFWPPQVGLFEDPLTGKYGI